MQEFPPFRLDPVNQCLWHHRETADDEHILLPPTAFAVRKGRRFLLIGLGSYVLMRVWSGIFFVPEMLAFQRVPLDAPASLELAARVAR
jgi:hypothetical protein